VVCDDFSCAIWQVPPKVVDLAGIEGGDWEKRLKSEWESISIMNVVFLYGAIGVRMRDL